MFRVSEYLGNSQYIFHLHFAKPIPAEMLDPFKHYLDPSLKIQHCCTNRAQILWGELHRPVEQVVSNFYLYVIQLHSALICYCKWETKS